MPSFSRIALLFAAAIAASAGAAASGCGSDNGGSTFDSGTDDGGGGGSGNDAPYVDDAPTIAPDGPYNDFPKDPIIDGQSPASSGTLFGGATAASGGGPCLLEPEIGSMFPKNWVRPRFRWIAVNGLADAGGGRVGDAGPGGNLFELRIHADNQVNDLVVYTSGSSWTMPKDMWEGLRNHSAGVGMTVSLKGGTFDGAKLDGVAQGASGPITIAPVDAPGTIVYWTTTSGGPSDAGGYNPVLKGFKVGDESVQDVLRPSQIQVADGGAPYHCVGCHSSTPDGNYAAVSVRPGYQGGPPTGVALRGVDGGASAPSFVTQEAQSLLDRADQSEPVFTKAHWAPGDRVAVSMLSLAGLNGPYEIAWTDLETTSTQKDVGWGIVQRTGDARHPAGAALSHDGKTIVYVSSDDVDTAGNIVTSGEIWTVPYGDRKGGAASALQGANAPSSKQYYPSFSPDDRFVTFSRSPAGTSSYDDPKGEVYVVPAGGGDAQRLTANDPPACSGATSPGVYNSWPKWSPAVRTVGDKSYYFIVFSSARNHGTERFGARLYVTPVVVQGATITTYAALYLWNQPENEDNHSPAWDEFQIPPPNVK